MTMASPESFACNTCSLLCGSAEVLQQHIAIEHMWNQVASFECTICQTLFRQKKEVISHIKKVHYNNNGLERRQEISPTAAEEETRADCPLCDMPFASTAAVQAHIRRQECPEISQESSGSTPPTPANMEKCCCCEETFADPHERKVHIDTDHLTCSDCGSVCADEAQFYSHLMSCSTSPDNNNNNNPIESEEKAGEKCHFCGDTFSCQASLEVHMSSAHFPVKCKQCSSAFQNEAGLKAHAEVSHRQKAKSGTGPDSGSEEVHGPKRTRGMDSSSGYSSSSSKSSNPSRAKKGAKSRYRTKKSPGFQWGDCPGKCPICELLCAESELTAHIQAEHE